MDSITENQILKTCGSFSAYNCYAMSPSKSDYKNYLDPSNGLLSYLVLYDIGRNAVYSFEITNLQVVTTYPYVTLKWSPPANVLYYFAKIGVSQQPINSDSDCQNNFLNTLSSNANTNPYTDEFNSTCSNCTLVKSTYLFPDSTRLLLNKNYTTSTTNQFCEFCTQGATLYFCAQLNINNYVTKPWNGATVSVKYE